MPEKVNFEQAMRKLEEIAQQLEQGNCSLDESIELYVQASRLAASCQKKLDAAQLKLEKLDLHLPQREQAQRVKDERDE